jgi:hypothetical protein
MEAAIIDFISKLNELDGLPAVPASPEIQHSRSWWYPPKGTIGRTLTESAVTFECRRAKKNVTISWQHVSRAFIHFRKSRTHASKRTYLNVKAEHRGTAFLHMLPEVWTVPGLSNAKVAGPDDRGRNDAILFYTTDGEAREQVLARIRPFVTQYAFMFGQAPSMTAPVPDLIGVGVADEPPHENITRVGGQWYVEEKSQSFGSYRARLIFMALDRTKFERPGQSDKDRCNAFKRRVEKYFRAAGIDPDQSHLQGQRIDMLPMEELRALLERTETD